MSASHSSAGQSAAQARTAWPAVWSATLAGYAAAVQVGKAGATLPAIRDEFGAALTLLALYAVLISGVAATAGLLIGRTSVQLGMRRAGLIGCSLMAVGSLAGAAATGPWVLIASRVPEALGFALVATAMPALAQASAVDAASRARAAGLWATWIPVGGAFAMGLVFVVLPVFGWRGVFVASSLVPIAAVIALYTAVPPRPPGSAPKITEWPSRRAFHYAAAFVCFASVNLIGIALIPTLLVDDLAFTTRGAAGITLWFNVALIPSTVGTGLLLSRGADGRVLMVISFAGIAASAACAFAPWAGLETRIAAVILFGFFCGIIPTVIWASIPLVARAPAEGPFVAGLLYQGAGIGQVIGPLTAAAFVDLTGRWSSALIVIVTLPIIGSILASTLPASLYRRAARNAEASVE